MTEGSAFKQHVVLSCSEPDEAAGNSLRAALDRIETPVALSELVPRSPRPTSCNREHISSVSPLPSDRSLAALHASQFLAEDQRGYQAAAGTRWKGDGNTLALRKVVGRLLALSQGEFARAAAVGRRRHAMICGIVAAGLLALACAGGWAFARYELARNDALLERTLARVTALTRTAVAGSNSIGLPHSLSLLIVGTAERVFRGIARLGHDTMDLRLHKGLMLIDFARLHGALGSNELERARATEANRLLQGLAAELPSHPTLQLDLWIAHDSLGDLLQAQGRFTEAVTNYRASREILEDLAADPNYADRQHELLLKMGDANIARGFLDEALASYDESLAIAWRLVGDEPGNTRWQHGLLLSHAKRGDVLRLQGRFDEALASYLASRAVAEGLIAADPGNIEGQRGLAAAHFKIGEVLALQERPDEALASYRASNAIAWQFDCVDPGDPDWQRKLGISHARIGSMLEARNDLIAALAEYRSARAIAARFAAADPDNAAWQRNLGLAHEQIGDVLQSLGDLAGALQAHQAKRALIGRLTAGDPRNIAWQYELGMSHARIGSVLEARGDFAAAVQEYEAALAIAKRIADADRGNAQAQRNLAVSYGKLAAAYHWLGKTGQALARLRQGREMMAALLKTAPGIELWADGLALFDGRIAALEGRAQIAASPVETPAVVSSTAISTAAASVRDEDARLEAVASACEGTCAKDSNPLAAVIIRTGGPADTIVSPPAVISNINN